MPYEGVMSDFGIAAIAFIAITGATFVGFLLQKSLPKEHLSDASKDTVKVGMGMVATLAALVLGLLIGFATTSFNDLRDDVQRTAATTVLLDRALAQYGPETKDIRDLLRRATAARIQSIWPEGEFRPGDPPPGNAVALAEGVQAALHGLAPRTDAQRWLQTRALSLSSDLAQTRWLMTTQSEDTVPAILLVVLVFWLSILFVSFALFAPGNATVLITLLVCALSLSGSIFIMLELNSPFGGAIRISSAPMEQALGRLGQP
jgi:hypothetical protein